MSAATAHPQVNGPRHRRERARRARILHVVLNLEAGGLERLVVELANRADPEWLESHVLALQYAGRHAKELSRGVALHTSPPLSPWSMLWPAALANTLRRIAPDIVHTHSGVWYKASLAARVAGVRHSIHTDHGRLMPDAWRDRLTDGLAARRTNLVVAVSDPLAQYMQRALRVPPAKVCVIRNGVDTDSVVTRDRGAAIRRELGVAPETPIVGSVGRLDAIKGYDVLIEAFRLLRSRWTTGIAPVLAIAGDGPEGLRLRAQLAEMDDDTRRAVHLLGWRTDVGALLGSFDVFAMSSRSEGTSVSLLESMSARLCPVVTNVGGNADVLGDKLRHRLVPPNDPAALAAALRDALRNPGERVRDACRARDRVVTRFSISAMVRQYEALYASLWRA